MGIKKIILIFLATNFINVGCISFPISYKYELSLKNSSTQEINKAIVESNFGFWFPFGTLIPGAIKSRNGESKFSARANYLISWVDHNGLMHTVDIDLSNKIPKKFNGSLVFIIGNDDDVIYKIE